MKKFKVGQKVTCINGRGANQPISEVEYEYMETLNKDHWVVQGGIYTIRHIEEEDGEVWIGLEGILDVIFEAKDFRSTKLDYNFVNLLLNNL